MSAYSNTTDFGTTGPAHGWVIDTDHIDGADVGRQGPRDMTPEVLARLEAGEGLTWRAYDDDGEHYYTGRLIVSGEDADEDEMTSPLFDYAMPGAGAVRLEVDEPNGYTHTYG